MLLFMTISYIISWEFSSSISMIAEKYKNETHVIFYFTFCGVRENKDPSFSNFYIFSTPFASDMRI